MSLERMSLEFLKDVNKVFFLTCSSCGLVKHAIVIFTEFTIGCFLQSRKFDEATSW